MHRSETLKAKLKVPKGVKLRFVVGDTRNVRTLVDAGLADMDSVLVRAHSTNTKETVDDAVADAEVGWCGVAFTNQSAGRV
eukprot:362645-Chlamydomonas_euryale.AAC.7